MTEKLPSAMKLIRGTQRQDRQRQAAKQPEPVTEVPKAPRRLSRGAKAAWRRLAPQLVQLELLGESDLAMLELCCETWATVDELRAAIREDGFTVESAAGTKKSHPALTQLQTQSNLLHKLLGEFGLSPRSRKYAEPAPSNRKDNEFDEF